VQQNMEALQAETLRASSSCLDSRHTSINSTGLEAGSFQVCLQCCSKVLLREENQANNGGRQQWGATLKIFYHSQAEHTRAVLLACKRLQGLTWLA